MNADDDALRQVFYKDLGTRSGEARRQRAQVVSDLLAAARTAYGWQPPVTDLEVLGYVARMIKVDAIGKMADLGQARIQTLCEGIASELEALAQITRLTTTSE